MPDYGPNLFAGTAAYYATFRAKYPPNFFNDVIAYFGLDGQGRMLDLGCGTGELSIPLAKYFQKVLAIDPEPEMLACARQKAKTAKIANVDWKSGSSKDLTEVEPLFKLVTLGQSLHWMTPENVLDEAYDLIEFSGGLCLIGSGSRTPPRQNSATQAKDKTIKRLVAKYLGPARRAGNTIYIPPGDNWERELFPNSKFGGFEKRTYRTKVVRTIDQELGNLYSMSWARRDYFDSDLMKFESEFRQELAEISESGSFENNLKFEAYYFLKSS